MIEGLLGTADSDASLFSQDNQRQIGLVFLIDKSFVQRGPIHGVGEVRHERENLYRTLVVASGGIVWLAAIFFFPFVLLALAVLALLLPTIHWYLRRKGVAELAAAPAGWQTCISECASEIARQLNLSRVPRLGITGKVGDTFKHLFPDNDYVLLPSDLVVSPINNVSIKLMSDLVKYQLAHGALGQHGVWEEVFLLAARPIPFLYAGYRRACDLSADRILLFLSEHEDRSDNRELPGKSQFAGGTDQRFGSIGDGLRILFYCLYSLRPTFEVRVREFRKHQSRIDRRERIYGMMKRTVPGPDQVIGRQKGLWISRFLAVPNKIKTWIQIVRRGKQSTFPVLKPNTSRRYGLAGSVIGVITVCIAALLISAAIDEMLGLKRLPWSRNTGREDPPAKPRLTEAGQIRVQPAAPEGQETISESEPQKETLEPRDTRRTATIRSADKITRRPQNSRLKRPATLELSANSALRNAGHKGIMAVVTQDGSLTLVGSTFSYEQKRLAFVAVRSYAGTGRIKDLVYVVEE